MLEILVPCLYSFPNLPIQAPNSQPTHHVAACPANQDEKGSLTMPKLTQGNGSRGIRKSNNDQERHPCFLSHLWHPKCIKQRKSGSGLPEGSGERMTGKQGKSHTEPLENELHRPKTQPWRVGVSTGPKEEPLDLPLLAVWLWQDP